MDTVAYVEERLVVYDLLPSVDRHVIIDHIEAQVEVLGKAVHAIDDAVLIEEGTAALAS